LYDYNTDLDGVINFAVDKGTSNNATALAVIRYENATMTSVSQARGKIFMTGFAAEYTSVQWWDVGWQGIKAQLDDQIALAPANRAPIWHWTTANDYQEQSYAVRAGTPPTNGQFYIPVLATGTTGGLGYGFHTPVLDHSGIDRFARPWRDAYLSDANSISITQNAIFVWQSLHPRGVSPSNVIPSMFSPYAWVTQALWNASPYNNVPSWVGAGYLPGFDSTRVACHLVAASEIGIDGVYSSTQGPGVGFFAQPFTAGIHTITIRTSGTVVATANTPVAASATNPWPGGWTNLIVQIY